MPLHDWTLLDDGAWHSFHNAWISEISRLLNNHVLPDTYYAESEKRIGIIFPGTVAIPDVAVLELTSQTVGPSGGYQSGSTVLLEECPPKTEAKEKANSQLSNQKSVVIRRRSDGRLVAIIEIVSPANKTKIHIEQFLKKLKNAIVDEVNLLVIDLRPPGKYDRNGIHDAFWQYCELGPAEIVVPHHGKDRLLASYVAQEAPEAFVERLAVGDKLPVMPLVLDNGRYVDVPLEDSYMSGFDVLAHFKKQTLIDGLKNMQGQTSGGPAKSGS